MRLGRAYTAPEDAQLGGLENLQHVCWLALLLIRAAETATGDTWRNLRQELDRMHLVTLATDDGRVTQRSNLTAGQKTILAALNLPEPPKYLDFTPGIHAAAAAD